MRILPRISLIPLVAFILHQNTGCGPIVEPPQPTDGSYGPSSYGSPPPSYGNPPPPPHHFCPATPAEVANHCGCAPEIEVLVAANKLFHLTDTEKIALDQCASADVNISGGGFSLAKGNVDACLKTKTGIHEQSRAALIKAFEFAYGGVSPEQKTMWLNCRAKTLQPPPQPQTMGSTIEKPAPPPVRPQCPSGTKFNGAECRGFDGRFGMAVIKNESPYPVTIGFWHPDSGLLFQSVSVPGNSSLVTDMSIGSDWGVQFGSGNVQSLDRIAGWQNRQWTLSISNSNP